MKSITLRLSLATLTPVLMATISGCAQMHHVQVGEMDMTRGEGVPFDVKTSNLGLNVSEAATIVKEVAGRQSGVGKGAQTVDDVWKAITYGPRTGEVTFDASYADSMLQTVAATCPLSQISGITTIRETNKYPVISGEIVRVTGFCHR